MLNRAWHVGSFVPDSNPSMDTTSNSMDRGWIRVNTSAPNMLDLDQGSRPSDHAILVDLSELESDDGAY